MKRISSGTPWEKHVGYSRAIVAGNTVEVSGTAATDFQGNVVAEGDAYRQAKKAIENILDALRRAGAEAKNVVRTRLYVTEIDRWAEYGRAHQEYFGESRPATSMVEVVRLIHPDMLVEIEATAFLSTQEP